MQSAITCISAAPMPRVVTAGVPRRTPEVTKGLRVSPGTVFLLAVMCTLSRRCSKSLPVHSSSRRSMSIRWLSVPPDTSLTPRCCKAAASACAFSTILRAYSLNSGFSASPKQTAFAAITCSSGPPCVPGNTAELMRLAMMGLLVRIRPPRGPRRVLWVVVVTTSA